MIEEFHIADACLTLQETNDFIAVGIEFQERGLNKRVLQLVVDRLREQGIDCNYRMLSASCLFEGPRKPSYAQLKSACQYLQATIESKEALRNAVGDTAYVIGQVPVKLHRVDPQNWKVTVAPESGLSQEEIKWLFAVLQEKLKGKAFNACTKDDTLSIDTESLWLAHDTVILDYPALKAACQELEDTLPVKGNLLDAIRRQQEYTYNLLNPEETGTGWQVKLADAPFGSGAAGYLASTLNFLGEQEIYLTPKQQTELNQLLLAKPMESASPQTAENAIWSFFNKHEIRIPDEGDNKLKLSLMLLAAHPKKQAMGGLG